jgi:hypothetical protein
MPKKFAIKPRVGFGGSRGGTRNFESRGGTGKRKSDDTSQGVNPEASASSYEVSSNCISVRDNMQFGKPPAADGSNGNTSLKKPIKKTPKKGEKLNILGFQNQNKVKEMREKTMLRDNWNYFVNDEDSKTDTILRFKKPHIKSLYEKHLIASSAYSLRIMIGLATLSYIYLIDTSECKYSWRFFCYTNYPSRIFAISLSFFCTFPNFP